MSWAFTHYWRTKPHGSLLSILTKRHGWTMSVPLPLFVRKSRFPVWLNALVRVSMASQPSSITLTRAELYDRIWKTAVTKVAREFGISDVGLAKICRKHDVPRPPLGSWARLAAGQRPKKAQLPRPDDKPIVTITPPRS